MERDDFKDYLEAQEKTRGFSYKDAISGEEFRFLLVDQGQLLVTEYQRESYNTHVQQLAQSITNGFISVLVAVEGPGGKLVVIDGQHRLAAIRKVKQTARIPVLVVPKRFESLPLIYNIEKADSIKDKCRRVYAYWLDWEGDSEESLSSVVLNQPHLLSLAVAYGNQGLQHPSLVETLAKKFDTFFQEDAKMLRESRASLCAEVEGLVEQVSENFNIRDWTLKKAIVSKTSMLLWGRKRIIPGTFESNFSQFMEKMSTTDFSFLGGDSDEG